MLEKINKQLYCNNQAKGRNEHILKTSEMFGYCLNNVNTKRMQRKT